MRLDPTEIPRLPLPAALIDRQGSVVSATPEWEGPMPGSICYHNGEARLLVAPDGQAWPAQEAVMRRLLDEMRAAVAAMSGEQAVCAAVLGSGLELVAGWPPDEGPYESVGDVLDRARTVIRTRPWRARSWPTWPRCWRRPAGSRAWSCAAGCCAPAGRSPARGWRCRPRPGRTGRATCSGAWTTSGCCGARPSRTPRACTG